MKKILYLCVGLLICGVLGWFGVRYALIQAAMLKTQSLVAGQQLGPAFDNLPLSEEEKTVVKHATTVFQKFHHQHPDEIFGIRHGRI